MVSGAAAPASEEGAMRVSMVRSYGKSAGPVERRYGLFMHIAVLMLALMTVPTTAVAQVQAPAKPVKLVVLGDSLSAGLGLEEAMTEVICEAEWKEVRVWSTGSTKKLFDLGADSRDRFGAPYWFVHRGDFHRVLRETVTSLKANKI